MTQRQRAFCEAYLVSGNATEAAKRAGYSERTARSIGQRLLTFVDVRGYLGQRNREICAENTATVEEVRRFWSDTMRDESAKLADRLKASEMLARAYGAFLDRAEVQGRCALHNPFEALSEEELRALARLDASETED